MHVKFSHLNKHSKLPLVSERGLPVTDRNFVLVQLQKVFAAFVCNPSGFCGLNKSCY